MHLALIILGVMAISFAVISGILLVTAITRSPAGFEDDRGFHQGEEPWEE